MVTHDFSYHYPSLTKHHMWRAVEAIFESGPSPRAITESLKSGLKQLKEKRSDFKRKVPGVGFEPKIAMIRTFNALTTKLPAPLTHSQSCVKILLIVMTVKSSQDPTYGATHNSEALRI